MDDLSNRDTAQETGQGIPADQRDALKHCLDDLVALVNARFLDGAEGSAARRGPSTHYHK